MYWANFKPLFPPPLKYVVCSFSQLTMYDATSRSKFGNLSSHAVSHLNQLGNSLRLIFFLFVVQANPLAVKQEANRDLHEQLTPNVTQSSTSKEGSSLIADQFPFSGNLQWSPCMANQGGGNQTCL